MDISELDEMIARDAALRRRQILQPVGGKGDKIFPPTYPGEGQNAPPQHIYERRRVNGEDIWCVLVDSVQSQANRLEECLLDTIRNDDVRIPHVAVDFSGSNLDGITEITSLDAPHRIYDAILRDSLLGEEDFMESEIGLRLKMAKAEDASALLEVSPTALLFGAWHSTGEGGGLGAKFARCLISEIVGIDVPVDYQETRRSTHRYLAQIGDRISAFEPVTSGWRPGSRIDPLGVLKKVDVYKGESGWDTTEDGAGKNAKKVRPSEINHGNIAPSIQPLGITCDHLEHSFVLSFAALRRLRFGGGERDAAGRNLLAALGLLALAEQDARGYALRSRCDLVCEGHQPLELVHPDGQEESVEIDRDAARTLYERAFEKARAAGFDLQDKITLTPQDKLVEIVRQSQKLALEGEGGEEVDADDSK